MISIKDPKEIIKILNAMKHAQYPENLCIFTSFVKNARRNKKRQTKSWSPFGFGVARALPIQIKYLDWLVHGVERICIRLITARTHINVSAERDVCYDSCSVCRACVCARALIHNIIFTIQYIMRVQQKHCVVF